MEAYKKKAQRIKIFVLGTIWNPWFIIKYCAVICWTDCKISVSTVLFNYKKNKTSRWTPE